MNNSKTEKYLNIANKEKINRGLDEYIPLYPMLRVENNKLYIGLMLTHGDDNVWDINENIKPKYWTLIDVLKENILEFNKTEDKDFVVGELINKNILDKQMQISKYKVKKTLEYKDYLMNDIKNEQLPIQKELASLLGEEFLIDGEKININEYLLSNLESEIKEKIDNLVEILVWSKYDSITIYYDMLLDEIIKEYRDNKIINRDKIKLCSRIMNYYYDGVIGIDNFFNVK